MTFNWDIFPASSLSAHAEDWNRLCRETCDLPFLDTDFLEPLIATFGSGTERLALCHVDGELVAASILCPVGLGRWQSFQPSQLPLGIWLQKADVSKVALLAALARALPGMTLGLGLTQLDPRIVPRTDDSDCLRTLDYIDTAWIDIDGDFGAYWEQRGKNLRTNVRKQRSKLEAEGVSLSFDRITDPAAVPQAIAEYARLEQSSWKAGTGTAVGADNAQGRFYEDMMVRFCRAGRGEIWRYRFNDEVVAMDLSIRGTNSIVILKTAFDAGHKGISPATLMHYEAFKMLFEEAALKRIEFYGRVMEWHTRWTETQCRLYHLNAYRWRLLPALHQRLQSLRARHGDKAGGSVHAQEA